jgi:methyl-accepting chemotaxis protein
MTNAASTERGNDMHQRLAFLQLDADAKAALAEVRPLLQAELPGILDAFYVHLKQWPQVYEMFGGDQHIAHVKQRQLGHWMAILEGKFDADYTDSVRKVGRAHHVRELEPRWYIAGYGFIVSRMFEAVSAKYDSRPSRKMEARRARILSAINKAVMLDMDLAISIYIEEGKAEKRKLVEELSSGLESQIGKVIEALSSATTELEATATSMGSIAEQTTQQATSVSGAAEQSATNVQTVAAAAEELSNSIREISQQVARSAGIARTARGKADQATNRVEGLNQAADKIGDVIALIQDIAEQTNLLALNATIEAARAGEAGKGFAVVANEVKSLATQTAKATQEISQQIQNVQGETRDAARAIGEIAGTIQEIDEITASIAAAVEEQEASTGEISRNVQEASEGTQEVTRNISGLSQAANETGNAAEQVVQAVGDLSGQATTLRQEVDGFVGRMRQSA